MTERIVIAGASGFIGKRLVSEFRSRGADVAIIGRNGPDAAWGDTAAITKLIDGADLLINLAGKSVNCRYNKANRDEIIRSRVETTAELSRAVSASSTPPPLWFNASTATIYRHAEDRPQTESTGELGTGFSVSVARAWEQTFFADDLPGTRRVALRLSIVLGEGSVLTPLSTLIRFGLGGPQVDGPWFPTPSRLTAGTFHRFGARGGKQRFTWVHIDDVVGAIDYIRETPGLSGVVNVAAPQTSTNVDFMRTLRYVIGVPVGLPAYRWMLEIGSAVIRTETELVLKSRWVHSERLLAAGYRFAHPELDPALRDILGSTSARPRSISGRAL